MPILSNSSLTLSQVNVFIASTTPSAKPLPSTLAGTAKTLSLKDGSLAYQYNTDTKNIDIYYFVENTVDHSCALYLQTLTAKGVYSKKSTVLSNVNAGGNYETMTAAFYELEKKLNIDFNDDGLVGAGILSVTSGTKLLSATDLSLDTKNSYYNSLGLTASGKSGTILNITTNNNSGSVGQIYKPIVIGSLSTDYTQNPAKIADGLMSQYQIGFPSLMAGFGTSVSGTVNVNNADLYFTGGLVSSFLIAKLNLGGEFQNIVIGGIGVGFGARTTGTMNINNSNLYLHRYDNPLDTTSNSYQTLNSWIAIGQAGGTGTLIIKDSLIKSEGTTNNSINVGQDGGSKGLLSANNAKIYLNGKYSSDVDSTSNERAHTSINVGDSKATGIFNLTNNSVLLLDGCNSEVAVGREGGTGTFTIDHSFVSSKGYRSMDPINSSYFTMDDYANSWSASYLEIGYDNDDSNAKTNLVTTGTVNIKNNSSYLINGSHAGLEVGGGGMSSTGTLNISNSSMEIIANGAIQIPNASSSNLTENYLAAGFNSGGTLNTGYFNFANIGGSCWKDFGGQGVINLDNSSLKVFSYDILSNDTIINASISNFSVAGWGTKGVLNMTNNSHLYVGGQIYLGVQQDISGTNYDKQHGVYQISNTACVNVVSGEIDAGYYQSQIGSQGSSSPLTSTSLYTVLGNAGTIAAVNFIFGNNSQIIGSGNLVVKDVFGGKSVNLQNSDQSLKTVNIADSFTDEHIYITGAGKNSNINIYIGDTFNSSTLTKAANKTASTLTLDNQTDDISTTSLNISNATINFDVFKLTNDKLVVNNFDSIHLDIGTIFKFSGTMSKNTDYKLIDIQSTDGTYHEITSDLNNISLVGLVGVKGTLSIVDHDLILHTY